MPVAGDARAAVTVHDRVFGNCRFDLPRDLGDTVVRRADGLFAYQLVVTVDDLLMGVDDIVRGRDLLRSAALQLYIRERLLDAGFGDSSDGGVAAAHRDIRFAHLPLIDNAAGRRLAICCVRSRFALRPQPRIARRPASGGHAGSSRFLQPIRPHPWAY